VRGSGAEVPAAICSSKRRLTTGNGEGGRKEAELAAGTPLPPGPQASLSAAWVTGAEVVTEDARRLPGIIDCSVYEWALSPNQRRRTGFLVNRHWTWPLGEDSSEGLAEG
jgi:hypothetical protein